MKNNIVLDYNEVINTCKKIIENSSESRFQMREENDIGFTNTGLPIKRYSIGNGPNHIVVTGAVHGSELISTDFVLNLMEELSKNNNISQFLDFGEYTIDFIPVVNPEGYIITSTAVKKLLPESEEKREEFYNKYYWAYRLDDQVQISINKGNPDAVKIDEIPEDFPDLREKAILFRDTSDSSTKLHQEMFKDVTWEDIPDKYYELKMNLKHLYEKYQYPAGSMIDWSANGEGIDLNANSKFNPVNSEIAEGKDIYLKFRHSNMLLSNPGPINCPYDKEKGFEVALENVALEKMLGSLDEQGKLIAYFNYHGTGAMIYQRPADIPEEMVNTDIDLDEKSLKNYLLSRFYSEKTYDTKSKSNYKVLTGKNKVTSANDTYRLRYPADILVELSGRGGNPIAPFYNANGNYTDIIQSNISGFENSIKIISLANQVAEASKTVIDRLGFLSQSDFDEFEKVRMEKNNNFEPIWKTTDNQDLMLKKYEILDMIYAEFSKKVEQLEKRETKLNEDEGR